MPDEGCAKLSPRTKVIFLYLVQKDNLVPAEHCQRSAQLPLISTAVSDRQSGTSVEKRGSHNLTCRRMGRGQGDRSQLVWCLSAALVRGVDAG